MPEEADRMGLSAADLPEGWTAYMQFDEARPAYVVRVQTTDAAGRPFGGERRLAPNVVLEGQQGVIRDAVRTVAAFVREALSRRGAQVVYCSHVGAEDSCCVACGRRIPSGLQQRCALVEPETGEVLKWVEDRPAYEFLPPRGEAWRVEYPAIDFVSADLSEMEARLMADAQRRVDKAKFYRGLYGGS